MWPNPNSHSERAHLLTGFKVRAEVELRDPDVTRIRLWLWLRSGNVEISFVLYSSIVSNRQVSL